MSDVARTRLRRLTFGLLSVLTAASLLGTAFSPYLLVESPLLLVAVSPAAHHVVLAAASTDPLSLIAVATLRRTLTGIGAYGVGLLYGRAALGWLDQSYPRVARLVAWIERVFARFGLALLLAAPAPAVALFAGAARSNFLLAVAALLLGHTLYSTITYYVGDALALWTDVLTSFVGENLLECTLVVFGLVSLQQAVARARSRRSTGY